MKTAIAGEHTLYILSKSNCSCPVVIEFSLDFDPKAGDTAYLSEAEELSQALQSVVPTKVVGATIIDLLGSEWFQSELDRMKVDYKVRQSIGIVVDTIYRMHGFTPIPGDRP